MVHALDKSQLFLHPQGILLNVHDLPRPHCIEIHSGVEIFSPGTY
jgi:hypothetical protein